MSEGAASSSTRNSPPKMTKAPGLKDQVVPDHEPMPPVFVRKLRKAAVGTGCDIRLRVSVKGTPRPSLTWYHNDTLLPHTEAQDSGGLWIRDCHMWDAGLYTCVAANELGKASCSAILAIMDLGEDSEATEDETTEPQMEPKGGLGRHQDKTARGGPLGEGDRMMENNPDASDRRGTLPGSYDPVVERELRTLGSRPPGPNMDPTNPSRQALGSGPAEGPLPVRHLGVEPLIRASHANLARPVQGSEESVSVGSDYYGSMFSLYRGRTFSMPLIQSDEESHGGLPSAPSTSPQSFLIPNTKHPEAPNQDQDKHRPQLSQAEREQESIVHNKVATKLTFAGPKCSDKTKALEERRASVDLSALRSTSELNYSGKRNDTTQKRAAFKQRASSLEDKMSYSQHVQGYQTKFSEELERIKNLVGGVSMRKSFSTERLLTGKLEPTAPKVAAKERAMKGAQAEEAGRPQTLTTVPEKAKPSPKAHSEYYSSQEKIGNIRVTMETALVHQLPGQPLPTATKTTHSRKRTQKSPNTLVITSAEHQSPPSKENDRFPSPTGKHVSPVTVRGSESQYPTKPPRLSPSPTPSISPLLKRRKEEKVVIPTILVEDETKTECDAGQMRTNEVKRGAAEEQSGRLDEEHLSPQACVMELHGCASATTKNVHFKEPPSFQVGPCDQAVIEGQDVVISVKVTGQPKPMIYWLKDKVPVKTAGRFSIREKEDGANEIRIISAQRSDSGLYACKLVNERGTKQEECSVEVKTAAQMHLKIIREIKELMVEAGESAMFECHITGPPDVDVDWLSNGKLIQPALLNCKMHFDGRRCRLLLNSVHEDDSGTYTCKLSTAKDELTSSANLKVTPSKEPLFTRKLDVLEVIAGRTARLDCKVSGSPAPQVTWMHFESTVEESDNVCILSEGGRHSLVIANVSSDTEGFYTAVAQNIHGKADCTAELYIQEHRAAVSSHMSKLEKMPSIPEEPEQLETEVVKRTMPDFVKPLADLEVIEGKEAVLNCKVMGLPYPTITWYHNGKRIESSEERQMTQNRDLHSLVIQTACHADGGVYKAVIANKVGKAACYAHLYVSDIVPDPPDGPPIIEAITGKTISLSWNKSKRLNPFYDSGSLSYVLQQQALGSIQWSTIASNLRETSYTITSLSKGVRYAFRVLTSTGKTLSRPSPFTDLVQLEDRGPYLRKAPVIVDKPDIVYVVENQPVIITVTLNHVHATVTWKRRGVALVNKPGVCEMSMPDDDQHSLKLQRVRALDIGQLVVMASNQFGSDLCTLQLVMAVPPKFETIMEDVDVCAGETSRLAVVVEGKPDPDILWYKDDLLLSEGSHFTFVYDDPEYSLVILNAHPEHSGVYTCTAKNLAASNSCKAELTVHTEQKEDKEPMEDEGTILRKMRRLTDYYDLHKEIGRGTYSYVKRVTQKNGKKGFAAKFTSARGKRKALALREMELLSELNHERIIFFHDAFEKKNLVVLITALCHEEMLERMCRRTTVTELEIRQIVQQVLEGLRYLHEKDIAHLDIKPENILMAVTGSDQIRICDFGNAIKLESSEEHYCKYGTPEYVAPEIVNQSPVSRATDIWPVAVITYLCLTGVSPFAGENDRATVLNIRNYNVAFDETMFSDLCKEAKGFVIKLLVVDRLRPSATECLRHPWFKSESNKSICTTRLKQVLSRRRWQRSLISYKSKMVMRTIPELLNDASSHVSIAVPRHLKEGSPPPSSSSDSEADVDELPFIPMPLSMFFSGSRVSLNEIPANEHVTERPTDIADRTKNNLGTAGIKGEAGESVTRKDENRDEQLIHQAKRAPLQKGLSTETEESQTKARRSTMRRGSSADSALLLHMDPEHGDISDAAEMSSKSLKKTVSLELPNRSPSPGMTKLSQEDYALKLELMRQRLLRGGALDKKMSGLRGPLFETLGMEDERQTASLDRNLRRSRAGPSTLMRAASSESAGQDTPKTKVFQKSASFTQEDSEPMPLHRRYGAPLEIPSMSTARTEGKKLQEATSMSALTEQTMMESPTERNSFIYPATGEVDQQDKQKNQEKRTNKEKVNQTENEPRSFSLVAPLIVIEEDDEAEDKRKALRINKEKMMKEKETSRNTNASSAYESASEAVAKSSGKSDQVCDKLNGHERKDIAPSPQHPAVFAKVATADRSSSSLSSSSNPETPGMPRQPLLRTDIKDIDSEEIFEARFKKRESSLTRSLRKLARNKSEGKSPTLNRKIGHPDDEVYRPGQRGAPLEMVSREKSKSVQDLREDKEKEAGLSLIGRWSMRGKRSTSVDKKVEKSTERKTLATQESAAPKRVTWAIGRSKSLDTKEQEEKAQTKADESAVSAMRRVFESKMAGISAKIRSQSEDRKDKTAEGSQKEQQLRRLTDSPILAMRQKFENKIAGTSTKIRSLSDQRQENTEEKKTPLFSRHRHSHSEGRGLKGMGVPENQLAKQAGMGAPKESMESTSSIQSEKENDRRSRWDRWGLTKSKKDKTLSQTDFILPAPKEEETSRTQKFSRSASDFPPVFHIKLKDQILLEGEQVTLSCLPAGSPHPDIAWMKDRKALDADDRISLISHPDGRQLLTILKCSQRDAGVYECVATNPLAAITTSCTLTIAYVPKRPGTPEVPQTYNNTALVLWKPSDTKPPCSYTLERKTEGDSTWQTVATGVVDCYYNVTDLPRGDVFRFRVFCENKAGQGPHSNCSAPVNLDSAAEESSPVAAIVKTAAISGRLPSHSSAVPDTSTMIIPTSTMTGPENAASPLASLPPAVLPSSHGASRFIETSSAPSTNTNRQTDAPKISDKVPSAPFIPAKLQSPVNIVSPMTQTPTTLVTPPSSPTKPALAPMYIPITTAPSQMSFSPKVLQISSLSPMGDGTCAPTRSTPSARTTPSTALRQGVPQKPYTFLEEKSRGRFGVIRECRENATGKMYMAKIIPYTQENKKEVLKEYEILKSLHNEKIMALHEAYVTPRYVVLVAEYCSGKELLHSLVERFRYSEDDVVDYLVQILQGVEYLHNRRVLHLDLKPDNIMVTNLNTIKIVDFGSAQSFNPLSLKQQNLSVISLEYMAPEIVKGEVVGPPADVWTVGVVTYIMLSGQLPFEDKDPQRVKSKILMAKFDPTRLYPNVSQSASAFVKKMLSSYAWARPTTRDCFTQAWLQDSYMMKLRRQTLTFTTGRLKEFLVVQQCHRAESTTKHKVLLRSYQSTPKPPSSEPGSHVPDSK